MALRDDGGLSLVATGRLAGGLTDDADQIRSDLDGSRLRGPARLHGAFRGPMGSVREEERVSRAGGILVDQPVRRVDAPNLRRPPRGPAIYPRARNGPVRLHPK